MDGVLTMRTKVDNELTKELRALLDERISPSFSGNLACPSCVLDICCSTNFVVDVVPHALLLVLLLLVLPLLLARGCLC
jgi:hypothetical protein